MIHQELSPVEHRSIMENIWLGREPKTKLGLVDHKKMYEMTKEVLKEIDFNEDPKTLVASLTVANMQMIEIAKALSYNAKLIIMDEPTSALTNKEIDQLFSIMRRLRENGKSIIYISHKLEEIYEISDRITVYRDGQYIGEGFTKDITINDLIKMMVGREVNEMFPKVICDIGDIKMEVKGLSYGRKFKDVSFNVRKGEILGIAGLVGAGRTEVIETIFGIRDKSSGQIFIDGKEVYIKKPSDAKQNKIALLTEDRRSTGIFPMLTVFPNVIMANFHKTLRKT